MTVTTKNTETTAALKNVALCLRALERAMNRAGHLPGFVIFYGPSGWGKTYAATYAHNKLNAYYVACKSDTTKKSLLTDLLKEMGVRPERTAPEMRAQVAEQLVVSGRPLIIDEIDWLVQRETINVIYDVFESSFAPILMIGEEQIEKKLARWERFHNRVLEWQQAQPADIDDARSLARLYAPDLKIGDALLKKVLEASRGAARRVCVNIERIKNEARQLKAASIDLDAWGKRELYTGDAPARRIA